MTIGTSIYKILSSKEKRLNQIKLDMHKSQGQDFQVLRN